MREMTATRIAKNRKLRPVLPILPGHLFDHGQKNLVVTDVAFLHVLVARARSITAHIDRKDRAQDRAVIVKTEFREPFAKLESRGSAGSVDGNEQIDLFPSAAAGGTGCVLYDTTTTLKPTGVGSWTTFTPCVRQCTGALSSLPPPPWYSSPVLLPRIDVK